LALLLRMEAVKLRSRSGVAKLAGVALMRRRSLRPRLLRRAGAEPRASPTLLRLRPRVIKR
jgi:hypothetical protein